MNELALFAGAGGGILGGHLLGWRTVCAVEWEQYPASVLCARQNDGLLPPFPIWNDVQTFDGKPWRGIVDVVSGGFPCQDISAAKKGAGIDGERSGMWGEMARIIYEVRPRYVFVENSPMLTSRGLGRVLGDLATMGFDAKWGVLGAADVGANHQRDRIWIVAKWRGQLSHAQHDRIGRWEQQQKSIEKENGELADSNGGFIKTWVNPRILEQSDSQGQAVGHTYGSTEKNVANTINEGLWSCSRGYGEQSHGQNREWVNNKTRSGANVEFAKIGKPQNMEKEMGDTQSTRLTPCFDGQRQGKSWGASIGSSQWWQAEPNVGRVADGVASRVDRLKAIGNGQVPLCAATAWRILSQ